MTTPKIRWEPARNNAYEAGYVGDLKVSLFTVDWQQNMYRLSCSLPGFTEVARAKKGTEEQMKARAEAIWAKWLEKTGAGS